MKSEFKFADESFDLFISKFEDLKEKLPEKEEELVGFDIEKLI